jgi:Protein of unknown function (DUF4011)/AAA domain
MWMEQRRVLGDGGDRWPAGLEGLIRSVISGWRVSLIDVTAGNRLLDLRLGQPGVVEVARPVAGDVLARLWAGGTFAFRSLKPWAGAATGVPPPAPYVLDTDMEPDALDAALRVLMQWSDQQYLDRGVPVLFLAFGTVRWADRDGAHYTSPVLLVPTRLVASGPRQPPLLEPAEGDAVVNPALSLELSRYQVTLPQMGVLSEVTLRGLLGAVREAVASRSGWVVAESVALSCFPPMTAAVYRDLLDHEDLVAAHPVVRALAVHGRAGTDRASMGPDVPGTSTNPYRGAAPLILPADSSQRACISAALAGRSFMIDGPPGTGKSQTIANIIGALMHAGKTVLVVSEKAAALDVVAGRLAAAGLGPYLLELHSGKEARPVVAESLGTALDTVPVAPPAEPLQVPGLVPEQLSAYAEAVNRVRDGLGCSVHDVLAVIASLQSVPAAPATGLAPLNLTAEMLGEIRRAAAAMAAAWRPAAQGRLFPWRGVTEHGPLENRLYRAAAALDALADMIQVNQALADATGLTRPSDALAIARLLDHLERWPEGVPDAWLTIDTLEVVDAAAVQLAAALTAITSHENQASQAAGISWRAIPQPDGLPTAKVAVLAGPDPAFADISDLGGGQITALARDFSAAADQLESCFGRMSSLAGLLGLAAPVTFADASGLLALADLAAEPDRPERSWLSARGQQAASHAAHVLCDAHRALATAEANASAYFTQDALRHDLAGLVQQLTYEYRGLGRLSADYRAAKKTLRAFTREGITEEAAQEQLGLAEAWKHAAGSFAAAEETYAALLGRYYAGRATNFRRLGRALTHAANAVRCAHGQDLSRAADYIAREAPPSRDITSIAAQARRELAAWHSTMAAAAAARPELLDGTIPGTAGWLRARLAPLHAASEYTRVVSEAVGRPVTFSQARQLVALREAADNAHAQLAARDAIFRDLCGPLYAGDATDITALLNGLEWARRLREMITGGPAPLTAAHLAAAESAAPTGRGLTDAVGAWQETSADLLAAFSPHRRPELAAELDDYHAGRQLLEAMFNDTSGPGEWHTYQAARGTLAAQGLGPAIDFCITQRVKAAQVPQVIERTLLHEWTDHQVRNDPALAPLRGVGRDALAEGYQRLDHALTAAAASDIIRACNARRPARGTGESALIHREAAKTSRHIPVRELLEHAREVTQAIKPCFLMPPVAVSQHLPPSMSFDVVIFDEASQISPGNAVNCIYRGTALILAGDRNQLPPSRAVGSVLDAGQRQRAGPAQAPGPESVLDLAQGSGVFANLALRWHYRSRQEALIAYSNTAFYDGRLIPLPSGGPETGSRLFYGAGTYRRRTFQDNPREAARVTQRIIHHYDTHPELSLGVITFSQPQADAIATALANARRQRPDLDRHFTTGRLHGFFIKTVEAVQGDERDVLILSIGYGPDEDGRVTMDFGPLSKPGGWRRLNVAITRARDRLEIVTSLHPRDIPETVTSDGLKHLRRYLTFAFQDLPGGGSPARLEVHRHRDAHRRAHSDREGGLEFAADFPEPLG